MLKSLLRAYANCKFYKKLLITNLVIGFLPLIICGVLSYRTANNSLETQIRQNIDESVEKTVYMFEDRMEKYDQLIDNIVFSPYFIAQNEMYVDGRISDADWDAYMSELSTNAKTAMPDILRIEMSYGQVSHGEYVLFSGSYSEAKNLVTHWTFINKKMYMVRPVVNMETGKFLAFLSMQVSAESLFESQGNVIQTQTAMQIYDPDRTLVYEQWGIDRYSNHIPASMLYTDDSSLRFQGMRYLVKHSRILPAGWDLFCLVPYSVISDRTQEIIAIMMRTVFACLAATLILSFLTARLLSRRIRDVSAQMRRLEADAHIMPHPKENDEIGQLSSLFTQLLVERENLLHEMYQEQLVSREMEFKALQSQINPHFLYNCLENINWRALMLGDGQISELVTDLADFYRLSVNKGKDVITLRDELRNAQAYLNLQLKLHNEDFAVRYDVDESLLEEPCIHLILQPVIENALEHGLDNQTEGERFIRIGLCEDKGDILITVINSGPPIEGDTEAILDFKRTKGYGLSNVQKRIRLRFPAPYGIRIRAVRRQTVCSIRLPRQIKRLGGEE